MGVGALSVTFEEELEEAISLDGRAQAPEDFLVRRLVGHIVLEENEDPFTQPLLVHLAVELGAVNGFAVQANELIWTHLRRRQVDPAGAELTDPVVVTELDVESLGELGHEGIRDPGRSETNREGPDLRSLLVLDDRTAAKISQKLVTPAGAEHGATVINEALNDLAQGCGKGVFPGDRERPGSTNQNGVSVLDVAPTDIRVVDEVDEVELTPGDAATVDKAALLLFEGNELVPNLEEHESKFGAWCCHFFLSACNRRGIVAVRSSICTESALPAVLPTTDDGKDIDRGRQIEAGPGFCGGNHGRLVAAQEGVGLELFCDG